MVNPIPEREKGAKYFLTILALKLIEKKRRYDINFMLEDDGLALFTGSDIVPCSSSLHSFDYGMKKATLREMKTFYIEILKKYVDLSVLQIDFHTKEYTYIAKISGEGVKIVTLRYRSKEMVEAVEHIEDWEVARGHRYG